MPLKLPASCFLLLLSLLIFGANIGGYDMWPPDEPRYAEVAREMMERGDYLVPRVNGETYFEKPPVLFWLMALCAVPFGEVNEIAARLPSVLAAVYVVGITYALAARLFSRQVALWSVLVLISCFRFWYQARRGQIDMILTAEMLTTLYAFWRWDTERRVKWLWIAYGGVGLGLLTKGPPALIFPGLFLIAYYWRNPSGRAATRWGWGILGALILVCLWYVPARMYGADSAAEAVSTGMGANLFRNTIGRALMGVSKAQPPWYYLTTLPVDLLPWTFLCPPLFYWVWKNRKDTQSMRFLWAWVGPALIFFSIIIGKRELYLLPLIPVIAILMGVAIVKLNEDLKSRWIVYGAGAWSALLMLIVLAPLALPYIPYTLPDRTPVYLFSGVGFITGLLGLTYLRKKGGTAAPSILTLQSLTVYTVAVFTIFPVINEFKSARAICTPIRQLVERDVDMRVFSVGFSREEYVYYARHFHEPLFTGLIGTIAPDELFEQARLQKKAQRLFQRAASEVPIEFLDQPSTMERAALIDAIDQAVSQSDDMAAVVHFEEALRTEVDNFFARLNQPVPVFFFVQESDWRWLIAFANDGQNARLIAEEGVGSRHVLLLANPAGREALQASDASAPLN